MFKATFASRRALGIALMATLTFSACGERDPEESFALWSNNEAGWAEIGKYISDKNNDVNLRARALEVLITSGQPTQGIDLVDRHLKDAGERGKVLNALREKLAKHLKGPNPKLQQHAKQVLFDSLSRVPKGDAEAIRKLLAGWAFGDMSHDDSTSSVKDKLGKRVRLEEIEKLGADGAKGAEIMLAKGIAKNEVLVLLQGMKSDASKAAIIEGLRRYHTSKKTIKVTEADLGFIQRTGTIGGLLYFLELYERLSKSEHEADEAAGSVAIAAAMEWMGSDDGKKLVKANYKRLKPFVDRFLVRDNCDDRWWAFQQLVTQEGLAGLKAGLVGLKDDMNYGQEEHANNDVKLMITDICKEDVGKHLSFAKARSVFTGLLADNPKGDDNHFVRRIVAIRCLSADASPEARASLAAFVNARKRLKKEKVIAPLIVPQHASEMTLTDLARCALDIVDYKTELDKLGAAKKLSALQVKWRKVYAGYSFDRRMKDLKSFAEERAAAKIKKDAAKAKAAKKAKK